MEKIRRTIKALTEIWSGMTLGDVLAHADSHYIARKAWKGLWVLKRREGLMVAYPLNTRGRVAGPVGYFRLAEADLRAKDWFWDCYWGEFDGDE